MHLKNDAHDSLTKLRSGGKVSSALIICTLLATREAAGQEQSRFRMIVRSGVSCHAVADPEAPIAHRYNTGDIIVAERDTIGFRGIWYFDQLRVRGIAPTCWVRGDLTVPSSHGRGSVDAYLRVANYTLARKDSVRFEDLVEVINLIDAPAPDGWPAVSRLSDSGLLQFRRLQLVERASDYLDKWMIADKPLHRAWVIAQGPLLQFFEPGANWYVPARHYWELYEKHKTEPWADAAAWHAAKSLPGVDECYASCIVDLIAKGPQRYWSLLPKGDSLAPALDLAMKMGSAALQYGGEEPATRAQLTAMRTSLAPVVAPRKTELLQLIQGLEAMIPRRD